MSDDRLLTWLVLGAIGLILFSTFLTMFMLNDVGTQVASVTGKVTDTGTTTTTLAGSAGITMLEGWGDIDFGSGYYNASCTSGKATLDSFTASMDCWINTTAFMTDPDFHTIVNTGTTLLNVTMDSDKTSGEHMFCGSDGGCLSTNNAGVMYRSAGNIEPGSCNDGLVPDWFDVLFYDLKPSSTLDICDSMNYEDENDQVEVYYMFTVPADSTSGAKTLTITYTATAL
jgi:hypothetical protein